MLSDFKKFVLRGNVVDLAVAVVVGVAFTAMVTAFVADLITPLIAAIGCLVMAAVVIPVAHAQDQIAAAAPVPLAVLKAGARVVHLSPLGEIALSHKLTDSGARILVTSNLSALLPTALKFLEKGLLDHLIVCEDDHWGRVQTPQASRSACSATARR